jgi:hypothetical protein
MFTRGSRVAEPVIPVPIKFGLGLGLDMAATIDVLELSSTTAFSF